MLKLILLKIRRLFRGAFKGIGFKMSIVFLLFSVAVSLMIIAPNLFDRVPVYSYFIRELKLPISYELSGKIEIIDADGNLLSTDAEIIIGGYSSRTSLNGEYRLNFSSPATSEVFVTIRYADQNGNLTITTESVSATNGIHNIRKEFTLYA